jgi:hypothetical protein
MSLNINQWFFIFRLVIKYIYVQTTWAYCQTSVDCEILFQWQNRVFIYGKTRFFFSQNLSGYHFDKTNYHLMAFSTEQV